LRSAVHIVLTWWFKGHSIGSSGKQFTQVLVRGQLRQWRPVIELTLEIFIRKDVPVIFTLEGAKVLVIHRTPISTSSTSATTTITTITTDSTVN
jgi:hypothetical protein